MLSRHSRLLFGTASAVAVACLLAFIAFFNAGRQDQAGNSTARDATAGAMRATQESAQAAEQSSATRLGPQPSAKAEEPVDWLRRMANTSEYSALAGEALSAAMTGDANAQFMLSLMAMECDMEALLARESARSATRAEPPTHGKCGSAAATLGALDGKFRDARYWLERAVAGRQPEAMALQSMYTINAWALAREDQSRRDEQRLVKERLRSAVEVGNPRALAYVAMALGAAADQAKVGQQDEVRLRAAAWGLLACRLGGCGPELGPFRPDFSCPTEPSQECLSTADRQLSALQLQFGPAMATRIDETVARLQEIYANKRWSELDGYLDLGSPQQH